LSSGVATEYEGYEQPIANTAGPEADQDRQPGRVACAATQTAATRIHEEEEMLNRKSRAAFAGALVLVATAAWADINIGVTLSATGPAASLGIPEKSTFELLPNTIAGEKINWIILDDASDTTRAVTNTRKLISEDKADVIVGSTITPNSLAMIDVVAESETPMIAMAAGAKIVDPSNPKTRWIFKTPQTDGLMADAIVNHMKSTGVKTMG